MESTVVPTGQEAHDEHGRSRRFFVLPVSPGVRRWWCTSRNRPSRAADRPDRLRGKAEDAFHVVVPSTPRCGPSGQPTEPGWGAERIADAWFVPMFRREPLRRAGATCSGANRLPTVAALCDELVKEQSTRERLTFGSNLGVSYAVEISIRPQTPCGSPTRRWVSPPGSSVTTCGAQDITQARRKGVTPNVAVAVSVFPNELYQALHQLDRAPSRTSSTTTSSTAAATSPPGKSRHCSLKSCAPASGRVA